MDAVTVAGGADGVTNRGELFAGNLKVGRKRSARKKEKKERGRATTFIKPRSKVGL